jgi:tetratricopeptide (TPR) repeat protein
MIEQINYSGEFFIENIKFVLGITNNITLLPFIEITDSGLATSQGVNMLNIDRRIFLSLLNLIPVPALQIIFSEKQNCRKATSFYGVTYPDPPSIKLGFVQVLENYNKFEEQLFIYISANLENDFYDKLLGIINELNPALEKYKSVFPGNIELQDFQFHCEIGNILFNSDLLDEALVEYRISLKLEGNNAPAFFGIAGIYDKKEDYNNALKYYLKTKNIDPNHPVVYRKLGDLNHKLGKSDQAIEDYSRVIEITGDSLLTGYSHFSLGIINEEKKKIGKAITQYKKAIKLRPNYDFAYYKLGAIYFQKGDYEKAIPYFEKAVSLRPSNFLYFDYLALAFSQNKNFDKAIWCYKMALKLNEKDIRTLLNLGFTYSRNRDFKYAVMTYRKALEINPENPEIYYYIGLTYATHGKSLEEALHFFKKALSLAPKHINSRNQAGLIYYILRDYPKAIKEFQACIRYEPGFVAAYKNLGLVYIDLKKYENAIDYYSKAMTLGENDFESYYNRGLAYNYKEEWTNSIKDLKKAEELSPDSQDVKKLLAISEKNYLLELEKMGTFEDNNQINIPPMTEEN